MVSGSEIVTNTSTNGCDDHAKLMTHNVTRKLCQSGERHLGFPSRYVGVLFAYFGLPARIIWVQDLSIWRISALK